MTARFVGLEHGSQGTWLWVRAALTGWEPRMSSRVAGSAMRARSISLRNRIVGVTFLAMPLAFLLLSDPACGRERPSLEVTLAWLGEKIQLAQYVDPQGDRWEWQPVAMTTCDIRVRETIHAKDESRVMEYSIPLGDVTSVLTLENWVSLRTPQPTIVSRAFRGSGDPVVKHGDSVRLSFPDTRVAARARGALWNAIGWCRPRSKEPF